MTTPLPPTRELIRPDEYTLSVEQELRFFDDRPRRSRFFIAPEGTAAPGRTVREGVLIEPWLHPWLQLNDPAADDMVAALVFDEQDATKGIMILVRPTPEAITAWEEAIADGLPRTIGVEAATAEPYLSPDYRVTFSRCLALDPLSDRSVRWRVAGSWDATVVGVGPPEPSRGLRP